MSQRIEIQGFLFARERVSRVFSRPFPPFLLSFLSNDLLISGKKEFGIFDVVKSRVDSKAMHRKLRSNINSLFVHLPRDGLRKTCFLLRLHSCYECQEMDFQK